MADTYFFNGRTYSTPTVMSQILDTGELPANPTIGNAVALIGPCLGGAPGVAQTFGDPNAASAALISGPLQIAMAKAFNVSDDDAINAPSAVIAMPVISSGSTQAHITLNGVSVYASIFGTSTGNMQIEVVPGSLYGFAVGVQLNGKTVYSDNVADMPFNIVNGGTNTLTLGAVAHSATTINCTINSTTPRTVNVAVKDGAGNYLTLANFVASFNSAFVGTGIYATVGSVSGLMGPSTPIDQILDVTTAAPVIAVGATYSYICVTNAIINFLFSTGFFTRTPASAAFVPWTINNNAAVAPAAYNFGYTLLGSLSFSQWTGVLGVDGTITNSDWAIAFAALQNQDVQWIGPLSVAPSVWAMGDAHVQFMSQNGRERRQIVGPDLGTSIAAVTAMAANLNSNRTAIAYPGYYDFNAAGNLVLLSSMYTAALAAAAFGGMDPGEPLTNKTFTVQGWEVVLANPVNTDPLIQAGVMCFIVDVEGYICARSISTWLQDEKYDKVELSVGFAGDEVSRVVRTACKPFNGGKNSPYSLSRVLQAAKGALDGLAKPPPIGPGIIVGDAASPPYSGLDGTLTGDVINVTFQCSPVLPTNFIPISISIVPYSGSQTAS